MENALKSDVRVSVAHDYSDRPGGRFEWEGKNSGERFREEVLVHRYRHARDHDVMLVVDLDGTSGYASSFLEEAFGGMIRKRYAEKSDLLRRLTILSGAQPKWTQRVNRYISQAQPE
jgi:hypothetical protein